MGGWGYGLDASDTMYGTRDQRDSRCVRQAASAAPFIQSVTFIIHSGQRPFDQHAIASRSGEAP